MGGIAGYAVADYLLQRARFTRRVVCPPGSFWQSFIAHSGNLDDVARLAHNAYGRMRYCYAEPLYRRRADAGDLLAAERVARLLSGQGRGNEVVDVLRAPMHAGNSPEALRLAELLAERGRVDEAIAVVKDCTSVYYGPAGERSVQLLLELGRIDDAVKAVRAPRAGMGYSGYGGSSAARLAVATATPGIPAASHARGLPAMTWSTITATARDPTCSASGRMTAAAAPGPHQVSVRAVQRTG